MRLCRVCNSCEKCAKVCPQKLDVPSFIKDVSNDMEGSGFRYKVKIMGVLGKLIIVTLPSINNRISRIFRRRQRVKK